MPTPFNRAALITLLDMVQASPENDRRLVISYAESVDLQELSDHFHAEWLRLKDIARKTEILKAARSALAA